MCRLHLFQEIGLPYMLDSRHAPDTFFFVFEADFRFYLEDCLDPEEWLTVASLENHDASAFFEEKEEKSLEKPEAEPCAGPKGKQKGQSPKKTEDQKPQKSWNVQNAAEQSAGHKRALGAWTAGAKPLESESVAAKRISPELEALTAMANQAKRKGNGDIIWFGWNPHQVKGFKMQPSYGSQLIGMTPVGARKLLGHMRVAAPEHFDIFLRNLLRWTDVKDCASYVLPPVGSFDVHQSGVEKDQTRENFFKSHPYCNLPPRPPHGSSQSRQCCTFGPKGHFEVLFDFSWSEARMTWWTAWPPESPASQDSTWIQLLLANHWIDQSTYAWVGPPSLPPVVSDKKGKGKGKKQKKADPWKRLRDYPHDYSDLNGVPSVISLLASQIVSDHFGGWRAAEDGTERARGTRKKHIMMYKMRRFCHHDEVPEVCTCPSICSNSWSIVLEHANFWLRRVVLHNCVLPPN